MYGLQRDSVTIKIKELSKRIRCLKVHCLIIQHLYERCLNDDENGIFNNLRSEFKGPAKAQNLNLERGSCGNSKIKENTHWRIIGGSINLHHPKIWIFIFSPLKIIPQY